MAKTLVGQLILRIKAEGLSEGSKVMHTMRDIESAARRLSSAPWGAGFQRQIEKLALSSRELAAVGQSWRRLHTQMSSQNLGAALQKSNIANWKSATISHLAQARAAARQTEAQFKSMARAIRAGLQPALVAGGAYTFGYGVGLAGRAALLAASEQARTRYRLQLAHVPQDEQTKMGAEASRLSGKYGSIDETAILELNRTTYALMGGNGDRARALMEPVIRNFIADVTAVGVDKAGENLTSFLKAMDNMNVNQGVDGGVEDIKGIMEGWSKAKQSEGKDLDIGELLDFARRAKVAKYALSDEFLTNYLPALGQDQGLSGLGDSLSSMFANFVTPPGKGPNARYTKAQAEMGLRDKNDKLVGQDLFTTNPYEWVQTVLVPMLKKDGVDTNNTGDVAAAVKGLMSNSKSAAAVVGWIEAQAQIQKNIDLYKSAAGTSDTENARAKDPFAAMEAMQAALRNLAAATLPMEQIAGGLNSLADIINNLKERIKAGDPMVLGTGGALAAAVGAYGTWKVATGIGALVTAGPALNTSAAALMEAAVALGGAGVAGDLPGGKGSGGVKGLLGGALGAGSLGGVAAATINLAQIDLVKSKWEIDRTEQINEGIRKALSDQRLTQAHREFQDSHAVPQTRDLSAGLDFGPRFGDAVAGMENLKQQAAQTGNEVQSSLSVSAAPRIDTSSLEQALSLARQFLSVMSQAGSVAKSAATNADKEMRRNMADYGVAP